MKENKHRLGVLAVIVATLFGALMLRLSFLQTVESASLREQAEAIPTVRVPIPPTRGRILDRNGKVLVDNLPLNVVTMDERKLVRGERIPTLNRLVELLDVPFWKIEQRLADPSVAPSESVEIARGVSESKIIYIEENKDLFPGVSTRQTWQRIYPEGPLGGHVLGYVGRINEAEMKRLADDLRYQANDLIGKAGVELSFERELRGVPGEEELLKDNLGRVLERTPIRAPIPGKDVRLTIDADLQELTETSLAQTLKAARQNVNVDNPSEFIKAKAGAAVVMNSFTGEVLAMASYPTYDPREFVPSITTERFNQLYVGKDKQEPLNNRAISGLYLPGSTWKLTTALAALKEGIFTPTSLYNDIGYFERPCTAEEKQSGVKCQWKNAGRTPHGLVDLRSAMKVSSDAYFYQIGYELVKRGPGKDDSIQVAARSLGFGKPTNVRLPYERRGAVPDREYKKRLSQLYPKIYGTERWSLGDTINVAIGQGGVLVTPLQLARAYATLANGGTVLDAKIELEVIDRVSGATGPTTTTTAVTTTTEPPPLVAPTTPANVATTVPSANADVAAIIPEIREGRFTITPSTLPVVTVKPVVEGHTDLPDAYRNPIIAGFADVVSKNGGTAQGAFAGFPLEKFPIAGKTGTAQKNKEQDSALFVGFGPLQQPKYVVAMVVEEGGFGRQAAAGVRRVFEGIAGVPTNAVRTVSGSDREM